jgi:hypothetical protein
VGHQRYGEQNAAYCQNFHFKSPSFEEIEMGAAARVSDPSFFFSAKKFYRAVRTHGGTNESVMGQIFWLLACPSFPPSPPVGILESCIQLQQRNCFRL